MFIAVHLFLSAAAETAFVWRFGHKPQVVVAHVLLLAEWDLAIAAMVAALVAFTTNGARWPRLVYAVTCSVQVYLYTLNLVSNSAWAALLREKVSAYRLDEP